MRGSVGTLVFAIEVDEVDGDVEGRERMVTDYERSVNKNYCYKTRSAPC